MAEESSSQAHENSHRDKSMGPDSCSSTCSKEYMQTPAYLMIPADAIQNRRPPAAPRTPRPKQDANESYVVCGLHTQGDTRTLFGPKPQTIKPEPQTANQTLHPTMPKSCSVRLPLLCL